MVGGCKVSSSLLPLRLVFSIKLLSSGMIVIIIVVIDVDLLVLSEFWL